jgi:hypothetical protein
MEMGVDVTSAVPERFIITKPLPLPEDAITVTPNNEFTSLHCSNSLYNKRWSLGCWLDDHGSIPGRGKGSFVLHSAYTGCRAHPASYPVDTVGYFHGDKAAGA